MIVTPIAQGPVQGNIETGSPHSQDAVERAKQAFTGATISRADMPEDPMITKKRNSIRTLKMKTNASPERFLEEIKAQPATENAIPANTEQTTQASEETKPISPQYAALARERRALQVREREIAAKQAALEARPASGDDFNARLKADPLRVLQEAGVTYDNLTEAILKTNSVNPEIARLEEKIASLEQGIDKNFSDRDTQSETQVLDSMVQDARELAKEGEEFEMVRNSGKAGLKKVRELIRRTYEETGEVIDVHDALTSIEKYLYDRALQVANINKVKSTLAPKPVQQPQQQQRQMRTLTNRDTAAPQMSAKARAIAAFRGELKR